MPNEKAFQDIAAVFRYDRGELARWLRAGRSKKYQLYILILAILAINFMIVLPTAQQKAAPAFLAAVCIAALGLVVYRSRLSDKGMTTVDELYGGGGEYRVFLREEGFSFKTAGREETVAYDAAKEALESESCFKIYYGDKKVFIIPKSALQEPQIAALSHLLSEKFGKSYRYAS